MKPSKVSFILGEQTIMPEETREVRQIWQATSTAVHGSLCEQVSHMCQVEDSTPARTPAGLITP